MKKNTLFIIILILLSATLLFYHLGSYSLWDNDEPLYSQMAREFSQTGDFLTLTWNGEKWFCHPPLYMWLTFISGNLFGWNEAAVRAPSAVFALLIVLLTYFIGRKLYNEDIAFFASLILLTGLQFFVQGRLANLDTAFTFFMMLSTYLLYLIAEKDDSRIYKLLFWLTSALGTLAKGFFALCLPLGIIFVYLLINKRSRAFKKIFTVEGVILYLVLGGFWYVDGLIRYKMEFYNSVFGYFTFGRVIQPVMNQSGPFYYYLIVFIVGFFPWIAFFTPSITDYLKEKTNEKNVFLLTWVILPFVFFTLVQTKLPNYIFFIYPGCSLILAVYLYKNLYEKDSSKKLYLPFAFCTLLYVLIIFIFTLLAKNRYPAEYIANKAALLPLLYIIAATLSLTWIFLFTNSRKYVLPVFIAGTFILYMFMVNIMISLDMYKPVKPIALKIKQVKKQGDDVLVFIKHFNGSSSLLFYLNEKVYFLENMDDLTARLKGGKNDHYVLLRVSEAGEVMKKIPNLKYVFSKDKFGVYKSR